MHPLPALVVFDDGALGPRSLSGLSQATHRTKQCCSDDHYISVDFGHVTDRKWDGMGNTVIQPKKCRRCERTMVALRLDIDGEERILRSCSHCDLRSWESTSGVTDLAQILDDLAESAKS